MTDEDRKKLCADLRNINSSGRIITDVAAGEIERLAEELEAQVDCDNQRALKAEMRCLALAEEIEHLNGRLRSIGEDVR